MKDQGIENFLKDLKAPAPDPEARLRAKRLATAEFERIRLPNNIVDLPRQDSGEAARLSRESTSHGSATMKRFTNRGWYAAAAGVGAVAIGLLWALPNVDQFSRDLTRPEPPATDKLPDAGTRPAAVESAGPDAAASASAGITEPAAPGAGAAPGQVAPQVAQPQLPGDAARLRAQVKGRELAREEDVAEAVASTGAGAAEPADAGARNEDEARAAAAAVSEASEREFRAGAGTAQAQPSEAAPAPAPPPPASNADEGQLENIIVTGARKQSRWALKKEKRAAAADAVTAEDIGQFPDSRAAAGSLQRLPGVAIDKDEGRDRFEHFDINPVHRVGDAPVSTFSADVDTASYSFVRARINDGALPQKDAVRVEEMINYFDYSWPAADSRGVPFKPTVVVSDSPWGKGKKLVHIGIKGYEADRDETPPANLVLLLDVSGSMNEPDKLPLVVRSMEMLLGSLKPDDTVGIVVYAGAAGTVLEPTPAREKDRIVAALRSLRPGGSTAGAEGIELAYELAEAHFRKGGVNRILLATDGDFNVGIDDTRALVSFVERKREKGVYLSVLGFGQGNYRDELAQALAQNGNGVAAYIDTESEARKVLVQEASAALFTIAKDVKLQVEFNPATVSEYRLVGYETRALQREDFNNDAVDAGDVGAGHTVTAIYEITPVGVAGSVDEPRYEQNRPDSDVRKRAPETRGGRDEYGFLKIRYKLPHERQSRLISEIIPLRSGAVDADVKRDVSFSTAVAGFAQLLRGGTYTGTLGYGDVIEQAQSARGDDRFGYRAEFIDLVRRAQRLRP